MTKKELLEWIDKELKKIKKDSSVEDDWWKGRNCGWAEALTEIRRIIPQKGKK